MSDEELEQDDLEGADEDDGEELEAADAGDDGEDDGGSDAGESGGSKPGKKAKAAEEVEELPSVEAKQKERDALAQAMEEFLSRGGKVQEIEANVVADPPKKPDSKYGSRPI
ncbi:transcriptional regulator SutA [Aquipseudomonas alcaligenes]|uniref:transcriptional regulator SutA n=1 Tax=Aquipseudomonas alcaligenes TaxID=43263 RepID=UPI003747AC77